MSEIAAAVLTRARLLGLEPSGLALLAVDALVLLGASGAIVRWLGVTRRGSVRELLAVGLTALGAIVLPAIALGAVGQLSNRMLFGSHFTFYGLAAALDRSGGWWKAVGRPARACWLLLGTLALVPGRLIARRSWRRGRRTESAVLAAILAVLIFYAVLATWTFQLGYDANTYRLSRIASWLDSGSIAHFATNDSRQNYVGHNADLVMLWLVSFFPTGYPLVSWAQLAAGLLACGAVYELGALLGWRRRWRLLAVATLLGIPTVAVQFFSAQTDLFATGTLAAGVVFALRALAGGREGDWLLAGLGAGLAIGGKGTVFYFGPGLLLLFAAWAALERPPWRTLARGVTLAVVPALLLGGFNFGQNQRSYGNPLAPSDQIEGLHGGQRSQSSRTVLNLRLVGLQVLEPGSNFLLPDGVRDPLFDRLAAPLRGLPEADAWFRNSLTMLDGELDEDHASFGLIVAVVFAIGAGTASARALRQGARKWRRVTLMALAVGAFVVFICWMVRMNAHQFRYFTLVGPLTAVVATSLFIDVRWRSLRVLSVLFFAGQLVTAGLVGVRSEYHGWPALLDARESNFFTIWQDRRDLVAELGTEPRRIGLALPFDSWLAPYLRSGVAHRVRTVPFAELETVATLGAHLASASEDVLIIDPAWLPRFGLEDVMALPAPWILRSRQIAFVPLAAGAAPRAALVGAAGVTSGGWTLIDSTLSLAGWSARRFELELWNPTPLGRRVTARTQREALAIEVAAGERFVLSVEVASRDWVELAVSPPFVPAEHAPASSDRRELGLLIAPSEVRPTIGFYGDRWTAPRASFELVNWVSGECSIALANPTPTARKVRVATSLGQILRSVAAGASLTLRLPVLPVDRVELDVSPPYVPTASAGGADDSRELGVLVGADFLRPPRAGVYR